MQCLRREADIHDEAVAIEIRAPELDIDHISGAVQLLGGAEHLASKAVSDHDVFTNAYRIHRALLGHIRSAASYVDTP